MILRSFSFFYRIVFGINYPKFRVLFFFVTLTCNFLYRHDVSAQGYNETSYVVAGSFASRENADRMVETLQQRGLDARIAFNPGRALYYVYTHGPDDKRDILPELQKLKSIPGLEDVWVYTGKVREDHKTQDRQIDEPGYVVVGSFDKKVNAAVLKETLGIRGIDTHVMYHPKHALYYVYTLTSSKQLDLRRELQKVRSIPMLHGSWILQGPEYSKVSEQIRSVNAENNSDSGKQLSYLITGSFKTRQAADRSAEMLLRNGLNGQVSYNPKQKRHYVYIYSSAHSSAVVAKIEEFANTEDVRDGWVYTGSLMTDPDESFHFPIAQKTREANMYIASDGGNGMPALMDEETPTGLKKAAGAAVNPIREASDPMVKASRARARPVFTNDGRHGVNTPHDQTAPMENAVKNQSNAVHEITAINQQAHKTVAEIAPTFSANDVNDPDVNHADNTAAYRPMYNETVKLHEVNETSKAIQEFSQSPTSQGYSNRDGSALINKTAEIIKKSEQSIQKLNEIVIHAAEVKQKSGMSRQMASEVTHIGTKAAALINKTEESMDQLNAIVKKVHETEQAPQAPLSTGPTNSVYEPAGNIMEKDDTNSYDFKHQLNALLAEVVFGVDQMARQIDQVITRANDAIKEEVQEAEKPVVVPGSDQAGTPANINYEALIRQLNNLLSKTTALIQHVDQIVAKAEAFINASGGPEDNLARTVQENLTEHPDEVATEDAENDDEEKKKFYRSLRNAYKERRRRSNNDRNFMITAGLGTSTYFGDLKDDRDYFDTKPTLNIGIKALIRPRLSGRIEVDYFRLSGSDGASLNTGKSNRNLSFRSDNVELNVTGILHLLPINNKYYRRPLVNPYGFMGIGLLYFNPKGKVPATDWQDNRLPGAGTYVPLQPLQTENVAYNRIGLVVPIGIGLTCKINPYMNLGLEAGYRITNTDYLDDVSTTYRSHESFKDRLAQAMADKRHLIGLAPIGLEENHVRGNPTNNDGYFLMNLKLEYYLPVGRLKR